MTFDAGELLSLYDRELRRFRPDEPGVTLERLPTVVRCTGATADANDNAVVWSRLDPATADRDIAAQLAHFRARGHAFEWKVHGHDQPSDLAERLLALGFVADGDAETLLALDVAVADQTRPPPAGVVIRTLAPGESLAPLLRVQQLVWEDHFDWLGESLAAEMADDPAGISVDIAEADGQAVCTSWIRLPARSTFATIWGGSTLPEYRGRGIYKAMVARHAAEARSKGRRYLLVDANHMSRPALEPMGFRPLTGIQAYVWQP